MSTRPKLASEGVVVAAPMSFAGSAARIWKITRRNHPALRVSLGAIAALLILFAWITVLCWYFIFGLLLSPYRLVRRGQRKRKREALMHREQIEALRAAETTRSNDH